MKTRLFLASFAIAAAALVSCQKNVINEPVNTNAIQFSNYLPLTPTGKGLVTDNTAIKAGGAGFGVCAAYTGSKKFSDATGAQDPDFMYNQQVLCDDPNVANPTWSYSPVKYWPTTTGDKLSFFAYAPYNGKGITLSGTAAGATADKLNFALQENPSQTVDFVASGVKDIHDNVAPVNFRLMHELTRVNFVANVNDDINNGTNKKTTIVITNVQLKGTSLFSSAQYNYASVIGTRGTWTSAANFTNTYDIDNDAAFVNATTVSLGAKTEKYNATGVVLTGQNDVNFFKPNQYLFLLPVNGESGLANEGEVSVSFDYVVVTEDDGLGKGYVVIPEEGVNTVEANLPAATLGQGKAYKFIFTFNLNQVVLYAEEDSSWTETEYDATDDPNLNV